MTEITGAVPRDDTIRRLGGHGDNFHSTWAADGRHLVAVCDGAGWTDPYRFYNARLWAMGGDPGHAAFAEVAGYPEKFHWRSHAGTVAGYWPFGTLAVEDAIYQFLSTTNHGFYRDDGGPWPGLLQCGSKLIYSLDRGATWRNQDGTTPVVWEPYGDARRDSLAFLDVGDGAFSLVSILQMGRAYRGNRDGYVYAAAPNGNSEGTMNQLVMLRVPTDRVPDRGAWEFFVERRPDGGARWSREVADRGVVHEFPRGWVNRGEGHPYAWQPSLVHVAALDRYVMASWGMGCDTDGEWFAKPSYLGLWEAPAPWGPWTLFHEQTAWTPGGDAASRCYQPQIPPGWIAEDGGSFWLVWTDMQHREVPPEVAADLAVRPIDPESSAVFIRAMRRSTPYYGLNAQRIDLTLSRPSGARA